jgi:hypothetical protein
MKITYYLLTAIFGLFGIFGFLRGSELFLSGSFKPIQFLFGVVGLGLAFLFLGKARTK